MTDFMKIIDLLSPRNQELVCNFVSDLSICYDPDWVILTEKEKRELEEISKNNEYMDFDDFLKELGYEQKARKSE